MKFKQLFEFTKLYKELNHNLNQKFDKRFESKPNYFHFKTKYLYSHESYRPQGKDVS